ncbi:MAG TPA: hypothetical protein VJT85_02820, partial [Gemmatimonadaceae bacterium]|nr:hypothetical protein [Gemmatimonadaceae bacterium]
MTAPALAHGTTASAADRSPDPDADVPIGSAAVGVPPLVRARAPWGVRFARSRAIGWTLVVALLAAW